MTQFSIICNCALDGKELQKKLNSRGLKYTVDFLHTIQQKTANFIVEVNNDEDLKFLTLLRNRYAMQFNIICDYALFGKELQEKLNSRGLKYTVDFLRAFKQKTASFIIEVNDSEDLKFLARLRNIYCS